ncbi:hypothetical protein Bca52824_033438 [Brassica carinata]|uniref:Aldehyde dehydrogenase domain-containing protein n=1 Tax=Brassica carinata TaxID=52824 RepID=A0A8X7V7B3_BRACI|nr:hypothetical protein Bca52824_033438 [Brassica carinata]
MRVSMTKYLSNSLLHTNKSTLGGRVLTGGKAIEGEGNSVEPTIIEISSDAAVVEEELFAPFIYVLKFKNLVPNKVNFCERYFAKCYTKHVNSVHRGSGGGPGGGGEDRCGHGEEEGWQGIKKEKMKHTMRFKKTWQDATKSGAPRMVGKLVYGVSPVPVSAALSVERREFYALFVEEAWLLIRDNLFEFDPDFSLVEHEQEGYGLTRSLRASSRRNILVMGQDQGNCFEDVYNH